MEKKIYFAYGSNLNHRQMAYRCPDAEFVGAGFIKDYTMTFNGDNSGVADIIPCSGGRVPVGVWKSLPPMSGGLTFTRDSLGFTENALYAPCAAGNPLRAWFIQCPLESL